MGKCIALLLQDENTLPAGIEFGEFFLNACFDKKSATLLNAQQFNEYGLWQLVVSLTARLKGINDRALHQKLWQFIVHLINVSDLQTRFQCIVSTALQCPVPLVQSLMFTELKNQIFANWNAKTEQENPFCSRQIIMVLVQRLSKTLNGMSLSTIYAQMDSLNACLNLCRFVLTKDKETNFPQIYDDDCPLRVVVHTLYTQMCAIRDDEQNNEQKLYCGNQDVSAQKFQIQMMKNQFLVCLDLVNRIREIYK